MSDLCLVMMKAKSSSHSSDACENSQIDYCRLSKLEFAKTEQHNATLPLRNLKRAAGIGSVPEVYSHLAMS